jgi:hypothetical protein
MHTKYYATGFTPPGNGLFTNGVWLGDPNRWLQTSSRFQLVLDYVHAIGRIFAAEGRAVFQSYDVFNEANVFYRLGNAAIERGVVGFIKETHRRLLAEWLAAANPLNEFAWTIGNDQDRALDLLYDDLKSTFGGAQPSIEQTYWSFHYYVEDAIPNPVLEAARLFDAVVGKAASRNAALPIVCSEFYGLNHQFSGNAGNLRRYYLDNVERLGMGAQVWSYLETNLCSPVALNLPPSLPWDGLLIPVDPFATGGPQSGPIAFVNNLQAIEADRQDLLSFLRRRCIASPSSRSVLTVPV